MVDEKLASDFAFPASPGDYFPPIMGDPGEELTPEAATLDSMSAARLDRFSWTAAPSGIVTATFTKVTLETVLTDDAGVWEGPSSTDWDLATGTWMAIASVWWAANTTGDRFVSFSGGDYSAEQRAVVTAGQNTIQTLTAILRGGRHFLQVWQNSGGNLGIDLATVYVYRVGTPNAT